MKNIFKIGLISRFVMLFLFIFGLNATLSTPALAAGNSYEIDFYCQDGSMASIASLEEDFVCSDISVPTTCDGKTVETWKDPNHPSEGVRIGPNDVCDYVKYLISDYGEGFVYLKPDTYEESAITVTLNKKPGSTGGQSSISVFEGNELPAVTTPTRQGYDFCGYGVYNEAKEDWTLYYEYINGKTESAVRSYLTSYGTSWDECWTPTTYNVTLIAEGCTGYPKTVQMTTDSVMSSLPATIAANNCVHGGAFSGWYDEPDDIENAIAYFPTGTYSPNAGWGATTLYANFSYPQTECPAGKYLPKNTTSHDSSACVDCPAGYYCGGGVFTWDPVTDQGKEICPTGYTSEKGKAADAVDCYVQTTPGKYIATSKSATQTTCTAGYKCPSTKINYGDTGGRTMCTVGTYAAAGSSSCESCPAGYYCPHEKMSQPAVCSGNSYTNTTGAKSCTSCPSGYTISGTEYTKHDAKSDCKITCGAGTYVNTVEGACTNVGVGFYIAEHTVDAGTTDTRGQCPDGGTTKTSTSSSVASCFKNIQCTTISNGVTASGVKTCYYGNGVYNTNCNDCMVDQCPTGYVLLDGACTAKKYILTLDADYVAGGYLPVGAVTYLEAIYDSLIPTAAPIPLKSGYKFLGWFDAPVVGGSTKYYDENGNRAYTTAYKTDNNTILYPQWVPATYVIEYRTPTSLLGTQTCTYGSSCVVGKDLGDVVNQTGATFGGTWETEECSTASIIDNGKDLNIDYNSCTAEFADHGTVGFKADIVANTYYLRYNANGGTGSAIDTPCTYGFFCDVTTATFTKEGSFFKGWSTNSNAINATYTSGDKVKNLSSTNGDIVNLYAIYGVCTPCAPGDGADCRLSTTTGACKYTTWCKDGFESLQNKDEYNPVCSPKTIVIPVYKTTVSTTPEKTITLKYGESLPGTFTWNATREGYTFAGLISEGNVVYYDENGNRLYGSGYPEKLTGMWNANTYKVTFNNNEATTAGTLATWYKFEQDQNCIYYSDSETTECLSEDKGIYIESPTKTGYGFDGYTSSDGTEYVTSDGTMVGNLYRMRAAPTTLNASWAAETYQLCFDANGGSGTVPSCVDATYDATLPSINVSGMSKSGYKFVGFGIYNEGKEEWSDNYYDANGEPTMPYTTASDLTLYAHWEPYSVNISYTCGAGNGQQTYGPTYCTSDASCKMPESTCYYEGYKFKEWKIYCDTCGDNSKIYVQPGDDISWQINVAEDGMLWEAEAVWEVRPTVTLYLDAGPCTAPENKSITIYEDQLDELYTILTSDKNLPNCDNIGGTYHGFYYVDMGENDDPCMINSDGACNGLVVDGDTLYAYVTYDPIICAAGTYLRAGWISSCTECPAGSYCGGSGENGFWWDKNKDQGIEKCPTNYTSYAGKAADKTDCYAVLEPGKYVKNAGDTTFTTCPVGSFCSGTEKVNYGKTGGSKQCWSGYYCPDEGMSEQTPCPAGYYCPSSGMTQPTVCSGSTYTETTGKATCDACPSGYSIASSATDYTDHDKKSDCKITCAPGYYLESNANSCSKVGYNYYSNGGTVGYGYNLIRSECPDGGFTSTETANRSEDCYIIQECDVTNGKGTQSCLYVPDGGYTDCGDCSLTSCENGFIKNASGVCIARPITIEYLCDGENVSATKTCYVTDSECRLDYTGCTKTGYTLAEWFIDADGYDDQYVSPVPVVDLIADGFISRQSGAFWEDGAVIYVSPERWIANKITVKYQVDGKIVKTVECTYGSTCNAATDITTPTQVGGIFAGWGDENEIYAPGDALNLPESGEYLLRAEFNPIKYAIGYHKNTGVGEQIAHPKDCEYDQGCKLTTSFYTKDGSAFLGWSTDPNATTAEYKSGASVMNLTTTNGDIVTLYAIYGPCTPCSTAAGVSCKLSTETGACVYRSGCNTGYNLMSGQNTANPVCSAQELVIPIYRTEIAVEPYHTLKVFYGGGMPETVSIPDVREGYTFTGLIGDDGIIYYDNNGNRQNSNGYPSKLTAVWTANSYTVTYNANKPVGAAENVSGAVESTQHIYDEPKTVGQNTYSLRGYTSNGWNTKPDGSGTQIESGQTVQNLTATNDGSVTLYSQWTKNTITIKLDDDLGDTSYTETSCTYGDKFTLPGTYRTGYTGYWAGSKNYFVPYQEYDCTYDNLGVYEGEVTLASTWTPYTYTITFNANGGSGNMNNQSFTYDVAQNLKANEFTRSDYLFAGWNTSADGKGTPYSDGASVVNLTDVKDGNVTLYAQWVQNIYTINVNYSCDGFGTAPAPMTCKSSDASCLLAPSTCKKDGYVFVGWLFDGSEQFAGTNISSYITLSNHAKTFNATAVYAETAFTMTVKPLSDGTAGFILGNGVKGGFAVDWGDDTSTAFNKTSSSVQNVTHVYSDVNREYLVQVASVADSVNDQSIKYGVPSLYVSSDLAPTVIKLGGSLGKLFQGSKTSLFKESFKSATNLIEISPTLFNGFTTVQKNFADSMFASCVSLPTIPLNLFVGITPASGATYIFTQMFAGCTELATITNQNGSKTPFLPMEFVYDILPSFQISQFALMLTGTSLLSNCPDGFVTNKTVSKPVCQPNEFTITTTDNTSSFDFALSAAGTYYIDWGDSTQVVTLDAPVSSSAMHTVSHTYKTAGKYKIQFAGQATEYYPDGQWGMNTSAISFANNTNVAEIDGSLGAIFATLTSGEQTQPRFKETFKGNTSLNGSIPETLLDGIHGQPSRRMFQDMFRGCTNLGGSIPSNMFANLSGTPTDYLFSGTFADCKNLSGQIPAFDTFTGTLTAEQNTKAFGATFWNAGVGANENGTPLFLPDNLFDGLNPSGFVAKQMELIFTGTKFATECPNNMYKVTATENPFVADWADKAMCNACPLDSLRTVSSVAGENNGATSCFVTCPENITITNGTTSVVKSVLNYTGTSYPSCTYNAQCDTGYDVQNNGTSNPTCGANTYTVTYQTDTQTVVDVVYGQQFEFNQPVPEKVGYTKVGWLDNNGKLYAINETITYNMAYNISVVPQYTANKYVATYDCDNASENITEEITYDADYTLKTNICTKQGYAFAGWTVDGNLVANSFKWTYPSDTVFIAKWTPLTYTVTYSCGEGTGTAPSSTNVAYDSDFTTTANTCTNVGYNFVGWKVSDTDNSVFGADETFSWTYLENKTFVAQWNAQKITCQSGQYLDKTNCLSCDAGYKCPAEPITYTYNGTIQGRVACSAATEYQNQSGQTMCKIVDDGYYKTSDTTQVQCGNNYYCKNSVRTQCADGGITDTATASAATQCYKTGLACTTVGGFGTNTCNYNLTTKDYTDCTQCIVDGCDDGYYLDNGTCVICPVGSYCANSVRTSCPINYTTKQTGAVTDVECFTTCSDKEVVYGTAFADNPEVFWPAACTHTYGISVTGNACKIVDNVCVETACNYNYEMINGKCELCVRDNALSFKQGAGNCIVETCLYGYYPFGQSCVGDTRECSVAGAVYAEQKWNPKTNSFGPCEIKECSEGTHIDANTCVPDVQSCELEHGTGEKIYNHQLNKWGDCIATSCMPGYTNDPKLTNETWKQCGQCNNRFGASGEPVVSGYISECEIATCMYQGEKYILENNECRLICDELNDETGSRYWNGSKCVHNCNPGFLAW